MIVLQPKKKSFYSERANNSLTSKTPINYNEKLKRYKQDYLSY